MRFVIALATALACAGPALAQDKAVEWRFSHWVPPSHPMHPAAEAWAAQHGYAFITLETGAANDPARKLYAALGFLEEEVRLTKAIRPNAGY